MSMQEDFEKHAKSRGLSVDKLPTGDYRLFSVGEAWEAYKFAMESRNGANQVLGLAWYHKLPAEEEGDTDDYEIFNFKSDSCDECPCRYVCPCEEKEFSK